jgi:hypothetical protein
MSPHDEIGRELKASELQVETVVLLSRDGLSFVSSWVTVVDAEFVFFVLGKIKTH